MATRRILLLNLKPETGKALVPLLSRDGFEVERLGTVTGALELIHNIPFDLIVLGLPIDGVGLADWVRELRRDGCASARTSLLALAPSPQEIEKGLSAGVNAAIPWPGPAAPLLEHVAKLLTVAPRKSTRVLAKLEVRIEGRARKLVCQSENLSSTGMLLRAAKGIPLGTELELEFNLPGNPEPLHIRARVMRETRPGRERFTGIGVRFEEFRADSLEKLERFLAQT